MQKKFELVKSDKVTWDDKPLFQVKALIDFFIFKKGELGGFIEKESNLSQAGDAWVSGDAEVSGNARVSGDAEVYGDAEVSGDAWVYGAALVYGEVKVEVVLCSRFGFETQEQVNLWLKKEKEFEIEVRKLKEEK